MYCTVVGYLVGVKGCIYTYSISVSSVVTLQALYPPNYPYTGIFQYSKIPALPWTPIVLYTPYALEYCIYRSIRISVQPEHYHLIMKYPASKDTILYIQGVSTVDSIGNISEYS